MRASRMNRLYQEFKENAPNIAAYFQMKDVQYTFELLPDNLFQFKIIHETLPPYVFPTLPTELSIHISTFLYSRNEIEYQVKYPEDYPFKPPKWTLLTILTPEAYKRAAVILNYQYGLSWSPAISVEKDVLNMIGMIQSCIEENVS